MPENSTFSVAIDSEFGSYEAEISIPPEAELRNYRVSFLAGDRIRGDSVSFTVGDPRLPTVELAVDTPFFSTPSGEIEIQVNVESFIGSAVGGSEITVRWELVDFDRDDEDEPAEGELTITTDDRGNGTAVIDLSQIEPPPNVGSRVSIDFQLVGPTSELIEQSANVRIEAADLRLSLRRTVRTNIPGQTFGVAVDATDLRVRPLEGDNQLESVTIKLIQLSDDNSRFISTSDRPLNGTSVSSCEFEIGNSSLPSSHLLKELGAGSEDYCDFVLPSVGQFAIEACAMPGDATVCQRLFLGRTQESWDRSPLTSHLPIGFTDLTETELELGSEKQIRVENPFNGSYALVSWGTVEAIKQKVVPIASGRSIISIEVDEFCEFDCGLSIVIAVPRQTEGLATEEPVPISRLFDLALPHTESYSDRITVVSSVPTELNVTITFPEATEDAGVAVVSPGDNTTIEVQLDATTRTEVTLIAVDRAVLDLVPFPLVDLSSSILLDLSASLFTTSMSEFITTPAGLQALIDYHNSRKSLDPWFFLLNSLGDRFSIDQTEEEYIDAESRFITIQFSRFFPRSFGGGVALDSEGGAVQTVALSASVVEKSALSGANASARISTSDAAFLVSEGSVEIVADSAPGDTLRLESDFVSTPLFETSVSEDGTLLATFTAPSNLGTFVVRAYAASSSGLFGSAESEIIVRRQVSLTPSVPRFVRTGDVFEAGAVVTVSGSAGASISLTADVDGPLEFIGNDAMSVDVGADGQEEARFTLKALSVGTANFTLFADDGMGNSDALQLEIEIEGQQEAVTVGTSFTVQGQDMLTFVEGIDLPDAVPGSGDILITAGVGRQPAVLAVAEQILRIPRPFECPVDADFALAAATVPGIINPYNPWNPSPDVVGEELASLIGLILESFDPAVDLLVRGGGLTTGRAGLRPFLPCPEIPTRIEPSFFQNARGLFLLNQVEEQLVGHILPQVQSRAGSLLEARDIWRSVAGSELEDLAVEARSAVIPRPLSISTVALGRAALGPDWQPETGDAVIIDDLSLERLSREFANLSIESQAYYILARLEEPEGASNPDVALAIQTWTDLLRITGRTAYVSLFPGATAPASDLANTLVFLAQVRAGTSGQLLPRLGDYIASPASDAFSFRLFNAYTRLVTMQALVEFDVSRGSAQPDLDFEAVSGNVTLLEASFTNASAPVASSRVPWEALPEMPEPIEVSAVGDGEASVAITLNFVPSELLRFPTYRGIFVERSIQLEDAEEGDGPGLSVVPRGTVVSIKVQFLTPDALGQTVVRVLMPAGLEPVDPNIAGGNFCPIPFFSLFRSFFFNCPQQETRPQVVTFTFDSVRPGTTSVSLRAVAATVGNFTLPPTRVFASDQPEVMGLSSAGTFRVCSGEGCGVESVEPAEAPMACPGDCNGSGVCNLSDGVCLCFTGFAGEACDILVES